MQTDCDAYHHALFIVWGSNDHFLCWSGAFIPLDFWWSSTDFCNGVFTFLYTLHGCSCSSYFSKYLNYAQPHLTVTLCLLKDFLAQVFLGIVTFAFQNSYSPNLHTVFLASELFQFPISSVQMHYLFFLCQSIPEFFTRYFMLITWLVIMLCSRNSSFLISLN